jgi:Rad3-related DNA helicase
VGGAALFSATLAPMNHYAQQLGLSPDGADALMRLESPFPPENLLALHLPVSVKYSDRERTLDVVVQVIHALSSSHPGNFLACFPSFAYLSAAYERYRFTNPNDATLRQQPKMDEAERAQFIEGFPEHPTGSMVAFIVLGGVFAEGVDLPEDRLSGAVIVSTGIPQIGFEHELMRELYDDGFGSGYDVAYTYPGMRRVLQAAGRVIRTENDRGVVLLLDLRFGEEKVRELMPPHWQLKKVGKLDALKNRLKDFWNGENSMLR